MEKTTIAIIDDHKIVRQGLKELLEKIGTYEVTHEFDSGERFIAALPLDPAPDLFILDYSLSEMNGLDVLQNLKKRSEDYKVLMLTQHFDETIIDTAYYYGARGFLDKNCTAQELKQTIDNICTTGYDKMAEILKRIRNFDTTQTVKIPPVVLSTKELDFLTLICDERELTYEQMADIMGLSIKSLESYRLSLFDRFNIKSKTGLVLFCFKNKLTPPFI